MSRVLSLRSRRGPYYRRNVPSFTVPVCARGACLCSRAMFERVQCVKTRILRRSEVVTCTYYTGDGSRTTIADVRPLDRTSSSCVYKIVIFWSTYVLRLDATPRTCTTGDRAARTRDRTRPTLRLRARRRVCVVSLCQAVPVWEPDGPGLYIYI